MQLILRMCAWVYLPAFNRVEACLIRSESVQVQQERSRAVSAEARSHALAEELTATCRDRDAAQAASCAPASRVLVVLDSASKCFQLHDGFIFEPPVIMAHLRANAQRGAATTAAGRASCTRPAEA